MLSVRRRHFAAFLCSIGQNMPLFVINCQLFMFVCVFRCFVFLHAFNLPLFYHTKIYGPVGLVPLVPSHDRKAAADRSPGRSAWSIFPSERIRRPKGLRPQPHLCGVGLLHPARPSPRRRESESNCLKNRRPHKAQVYARIS